MEAKTTKHLKRLFSLAMSCFPITLYLYPFSCFFLEGFKVTTEMYLILMMETAYYKICG